MKKMTRAWMTLSMLALCGCIGPGNDERAEENTDGTEKSLVDPTVGATVSTYNPSVRLMQGYTPLFEQGSGECLTTEGVGPAVTVGNVAEQFQLVLVSSREDLAKRLGIDLGVKVKYGFVDADARFNLLDTFKSSERSVFFLLRAVQSYEVANRHVPKMTPEVRERLLSDPEAFLVSCGSHYVSAIRYEAQLYLAVRFDTQDEETALGIKASLGVSAGLPIIGVDADVGVNLANNASKKGVSVALNVASSGFLISGDAASGEAIGQLLGGQVDVKTVAKLDALRGAMADSLTHDACRDAGGSECQGPGYEQNGQRNARVAALGLSPYAAVDNAPKANAEWNGYGQIRDSLLGVDKYVRDLSSLQLKMEAAYRDEIDAFLSAPAAARTGFGVPPPATPVYTMDQIEDRAAIWADKFRPDDGTEVGSSVEALKDRIGRCWGDASVGYFGSCAPKGVSPKDTAEYQQARSDLDAYQQTGRVLPLRFKSADKALTYPNAKAACAALTANGGKMRMPTRSEAERLAIPVAYSSLPTPSSTNYFYMVWHAGPAVCSKPDVVKDTAFYNPPGAGPTVTLDQCITKGVASLPVLCVPSSGPFNAPEL